MQCQARLLCVQGFSVHPAQSADHLGLTPPLGSAYLSTGALPSTKQGLVALMGGSPARG